MFSEIFNLIFPRTCGFCGQKINERYTCRKCLNILKYYHEKVVLYNKNGNSYDKLICAFEYKSYLKNKMLQYKFENKRYLAKVFGDMLAYRLAKYDIRADVIIPVPIHVKRKIERGYNQSEYIAKYVSKLVEIPLKNNILKKIKYNPKQSSLSLKERRENVKDVYLIKNETFLKNKTVLLVDDIFTTGFTANECARVLKNAGAQEVIVATVLYGR